MKKHLIQAPVLRVGDWIYTPASNYSENNQDDLIVTQIEDIIQVDNKILIIDSDGDELNLDWLGSSFFLSEEAIKNGYNKIWKK